MQRLIILNKENDLTFVYQGGMIEACRGEEKGGSDLCPNTAGNISKIYYIDFTC